MAHGSAHSLSPVGTCPLCGGQVFELPSVYLCANNVSKKQKDGTFKNIGSCRFKAFKNYRGGTIGRTAMANLLRGETVRVACRTQGGKAYDTDIVLNPDNDYMPTTAKKRIARCPACSGWIIEAHNLYRCENNKSHFAEGRWVNEGTCSWRVPKTIRGVAVTAENAADLARNNRVIMSGLTGFGSGEVEITLNPQHDWMLRFHRRRQTKKR